MKADRGENLWNRETLSITREGEVGINLSDLH